MEKIILFGTGVYGQSAYYKMKSRFEIIYFVDDNPISGGMELPGIPIISCTKLKEIYSYGMDIIICTKDYFRISTKLIEMGITDYYVMLEGFLYHSSADETMMPVELNKYSYFRKEKDEKNILYVQDTVCMRTHEIAEMLRDEGYKIYLLYTMPLPESENISFAGIYNEVYTFYTANGILDFIENSDFDIIHSLNAPDILTNIVLETSKHVVFDTYDINGLREYDTIEDIVLEYIAGTQSDGNIYSSRNAAEIARKKYGLEEQEILVLENMISGREESSIPCEKVCGTEEKKFLSQKLVAFYERVKKRKVSR